MRGAGERGDCAADLAPFEEAEAAGGGRGGGRRREGAQPDEAARVVRGKGSEREERESGGEAKHGGGEAVSR